MTTRDAFSRMKQKYVHAKARSSTSRRVRGIAEPSALRHHTTDHNERGRERGVAAHFHEHFHPATRPISSVLMAKGGRLLLREQKQKKGPDTHSSGHNRKIAFPRHLLATSPSLTKSFCERDFVAVGRPTTLSTYSISTSWRTRGSRPGERSTLSKYFFDPTWRAISSACFPRTPPPRRSA